MRSGKRTRRAVIRLRHALAAEKFYRWVDKVYGRYDKSPHPPHKYWPQTWHRWHALGCP